MTSPSPFKSESISQFERKKMSLRDDKISSGLKKARTTSEGLINIPSKRNNEMPIIGLFNNINPPKKNLSNDTNEASQIAKSHGDLNNLTFQSFIIEEEETKAKTNKKLDFKEVTKETENTES